MTSLSFFTLLFTHAHVEARPLVEEPNTICLAQSDTTIVSQFMRVSILLVMLSTIELVRKCSLTTIRRQVMSANAACNAPPKKRTHHVRKLNIRVCTSEIQAKFLSILLIANTLILGAKALRSLFKMEMRY